MWVKKKNIEEREIGELQGVRSSPSVSLLNRPTAAHGEPDGASYRGIGKGAAASTRTRPLNDRGS